MRLSALSSTRAPSLRATLPPSAEDARFSRRSSWIWAAPVVTALALGNCYSPEIESCHILCGADGACPDGLHCSNGYCSSEGSACEVTPDGKGGAPPSSGGAPGAGATTSAAGGNTGGGNTGGNAGSTNPGQGGDAGSSASCSATCPSEGCPGRSCTGLPWCGDDSCCDSPLIAGGTFLLGRGTQTDAYDASESETPEHTALVSEFRLDRFEVTVGRFRSFVESYGSCLPTPGAGAHPQIEGSGWNAAWDAELPKTREDLEYSLACYRAEPLGEAFASFTPTPGDSENKPIVCVDWYVAFAFCIWDGGRLPTETEWEYAAAGGNQNRLYPWQEPYVDMTLASYACLADGEPNCTSADLLTVGSFSRGAGRYGNLDLAGNAAEWVLDWSGAWYDTATSKGRCATEDCANLDPASGKRVQRGGSFAHFAPSLRAAQRAGVSPKTTTSAAGVRCARDP